MFDYTRLSLQFLLGNIGGPITAVYFIHANICAEDSQLLLAELISTAIFMGGMATFLQVTFGVRWVIPGVAAKLYACNYIIVPFFLLC